MKIDCAVAYGGLHISEADFADSGMCLYLGEAGNRCALDCLHYDIMTNE